MKAKGNRPCKASGDHHGGKAEGRAGLRDRTLCEACFYSSGLSRTVLFIRCQHCDHDSTLGMCVCGRGTIQRHAMVQVRAPGNMCKGTRSSNWWLLGEGHTDGGQQKDMPAWNGGRRFIAPMTWPL